ncbi:MAG: hypothetical protein ACRD2W_12065 [Acidimicrobiales bacterium]
MSRRKGRVGLAGPVLALAAIAVAMVATRAGPERGFSRPTGPCVVTDKLVNSCRPWFGATISGYSEVPGDVRSQFEHLEQRVGRRLDVLHTFNPAGSVALRREQSYLQARPDLTPYVNWEPDDVWKNAAGDDPAVNGRIDQVAENIKAIAPRKLFLTLHHEPENDVLRDDPLLVPPKG